MSTEEDDKKKKEDEPIMDEPLNGHDEDIDEVTMVETGGPSVETLENTMEELTATIKEKEKELLYLRAEFDNFKKKVMKERSELIKYSGQTMALDLVSVLDVFEKALEQDVTSENYKNFVEGVKLTEKQLKSQLEKHGVREIECKGEIFDPNKCEALSQIPSEDAEDGEILEVTRKGYKFQDKVLRHAQVVIAKK